MAPYEPGSIAQTFIDLGIVVSKGAELLNVTLGYYEVGLIELCPIFVLFHDLMQLHVNRFWICSRLL